MLTVLLLVLFITTAYAKGSCKALKEEVHKERAYNLYKEALELYEREELKEAYKLLKKALEIYDSREGHIYIKHKCYKLIPGAFLPVRKEYIKNVKRDYEAYELMKKIKRVLYPKMVVVIKVSFNQIRVSVYNLGKPENTLPADEVKVIGVGFYETVEEEVGDIKPGEKKEVVLRGVYKTVRVIEKFGFNPFPVDLEDRTVAP